MPLLRPTATPAARRLCPAPGGGGELMLIQITRFACGSLVVGHAAHHAVGDGFAVCQFLLAWGQATRGVAIDPVPVHDRESPATRRGSSSTTVAPSSRPETPIRATTTTPETTRW